jgi:hypothetical protein
VAVVLPEYKQEGLDAAAVACHIRWSLPNPSRTENRCEKIEEVCWLNRPSA